tara:strand:- start:1638 stop:1829 length:192 start_codon:yes stop_codon:yes gene_type:complete
VWDLETIKFINSDEQIKQRIAYARKLNRIRENKNNAIRKLHEENQEKEPEGVPQSEDLPKETR